MAMLLWINELVNDFRAGFWNSIAVQTTPDTIYIFSVVRTRRCEKGETDPISNTGCCRLGPRTTGKEA